MPSEAWLLPEADAFRLLSFVTGHSVEFAWCLKEVDQGIQVEFQISIP